MPQKQVVDKSNMRTHDDGHSIEDLVKLNLTQNQAYFDKIAQQKALPKRLAAHRNENDSVETFLDPREMLKKEINPMKIKKFGDGKRDLDKNQYFKDFKCQWDNEMHYVVDEYKSNIFPNAQENHSMAQSVAAHSLNKTLQNANRTGTLHTN